MDPLWQDRRRGPAKEDPERLWTGSARTRREPIDLEQSQDDALFLAVVLDPEILAEEPLERRKLGSNVHRLLSPDRRHASARRQGTWLPASRVRSAATLCPGPRAQG